MSGVEQGMVDAQEPLGGTTPVIGLRKMEDAQCG